MTDLGGRYAIGIWTVLRRCFTFAAIVLLASSARAKDAEFCDVPITGLEAICAAYEAHCTTYLSDPDTLDVGALREIPFKSRRSFAFPKLHSETLGFLNTNNQRISVVFYDNQPACELLLGGVGYLEFAAPFRSWMQAAGEDFVATSSFEPQSRKRMDRAFAAVFLAAQREDGRVTEVTVNWNLSKGLTRLKVGYMPTREYTQKLLGKEKK